MPVVTRASFDEVLALLKSHRRLALDTETTGLRPYHGDKIFAVILTHRLPGTEFYTSYYFNFQAREDIPKDAILKRSHHKLLNELLFSDPDRLWFIANAKYDMGMLSTWGYELAGGIHCTQANGRVEFSDYREYGLEAAGRRIGAPKDDTVEKWISDNHAWGWQSRPGIKSRSKNKHYDQVPFSIIAPYGERDGEVCLRLGDGQEAAFDLVDSELAPDQPRIWDVVRNERRLPKTFFNMEKRGVLIDREYCKRARAYEVDRAEKAVVEFKALTQSNYSASNKLFQSVFADVRDKWLFGEETKTGQKNPIFDSDALVRFGTKPAQAVLTIRDAKSRADFYAGFLYHADDDGVVHPNFNPGGTNTGRFSCGNTQLPNLYSEKASVCKSCHEEFEEVLQTCKKCQSTEIEHPEFLVRRAIIPRPGFVFIMPDYDQMEYRMMFDYACREVGYESALVSKIKNEGLDPHQATADVVTAGGTPLTRKRAKNGNFAILYGAGLDTLAATIGSTREEARSLKEAIFKAAPEVKILINSVMASAASEKQIRNWLGRRCAIGNSDFAYKAPNYLIQGGTADVNKVALNRIDEYLLDKKSKLALTIHDENPIEVHESELAEVPRRVKEFMEGVYPHKYLPLTVGMEWSGKSLADKVKGFPV